MLTQFPSWPYLPTAGRLALALAIGLFIGIERERRHKEAGLRTFAFSALLGAVGGLLGESYSLLVLALVGVLIVFLNVETIRTKEGAEITTSAAMLVTTFAGLLAGQGHTFTPTALGVATAALLAWKEPLVGFTHGLTESELRSAILLAMLAFVAYPIMPTGAIDPWGLVEPRIAWITVLLIAGLGFTNYILLKLYGVRGIELTGFLGGLINSRVTVTELMRRAGTYGPTLLDATYRGIVFATAAMLVRNAVILGLLAPTVLLVSSIPLGLMLGAAVLASWIDPKWNRLQIPVRDSETPQRLSTAPGSIISGLESPFSLSAAFKYAVIFLAIQVAGTLAQRSLGQFGFYAVSLVAGAISSASSVASAASLALAGTLPTHVASNGVVLTSAVSVAVNLPLVMRLGKDRALIRKIVWALGAIVILGTIAIAVQSF